MRVKVISAEPTQFGDRWYADQVGKEVEIDHFDGNYYWVFNRDLGMGLAKADCEVVESAPEKVSLLT